MFHIIVMLFNSKVIFAFVDTAMVYFLSVQSHCDALEVKAYQNYDSPFFFLQKQILLFLSWFIK